jgi:hypothetical protein
MSNLEALVQSAAAQGAAQVIETLGLSAGEIAYRKARDIYGKWFVDAVNNGRIRPSRVDDGPRGIRRFRIVDIQKLKTADLMLAELQTREINKP